MVLQESIAKKFEIEIKQNKVVFSVSGNKASFHHRDLVSIYYFVLKNIYLYLKKDIKENIKPLKLKNSVFVSNIIDSEENKIVKSEQIDTKEEDKYRYFRVAVVIINKRAFHLNLASLFEIKSQIERFFELSKEFEIKFYEKDFDLIIKKEDIATTFNFYLKERKEKEVLRIKKDSVKVLIRHLRDKMIYDWKLYNLLISDKFAIFQTKKVNTFLIKINDLQLEAGRDVIIAMSLSV